MPARHAALAAAVAVVWASTSSSSTSPSARSRRCCSSPYASRSSRSRPCSWSGGRGLGWRWVAAIGATIAAGQFGFLFIAMDQGLPAGLASLVLQLQVFFTILLAMAALGERPRPLQLVAAGIAFVGIAVIALGRAENVPLLACALCVCAALGWAVGNVCTRRAQAPRPIALLVWTSLVPPLPMLALSLAFEGPEAIGNALAGIDLGAVGAITYLVLASTWFGYGAWSWLIRHNPASQVVPFTLLVPPVGIASAWIALDEVPNAAEFAGGAVVLAGLALNAWAGSAARFPAVSPSRRTAASRALP